MSNKELFTIMLKIQYNTSLPFTPYSSLPFPFLPFCSFSFHFPSFTSLPFTPDPFLSFPPLPFCSYLFLSIPFFLSFFLSFSLPFFSVKSISISYKRLCWLSSYQNVPVLIYTNTFSKYQTFQDSFIVSKFLKYSHS